MTAYVVRPARPADAAGMAAIYDLAVRESTATFEEEPPGLGRWTERIAAPSRPGDHLLVAVQAGRVLGYAGSGEFRPRAAYRWTREVSVYVAADARRQGVARALYAALEAACRADGMRVLVGVVSQPNADSNAAHEACGFVAAGQLDEVGHKAGQWLGIRFYERRLVEPRRGEIAGAPVALDFLTAGEALVDLVGTLPPAAWQLPGLGTWDVRALVGHAGRALTTLADYAARPTAEPPELTDAAAYFRAAAGLAATGDLNETVRARGVEAGALLGQDPTGTVRAWLERARSGLATVPGDPVIPTALGRMRLSDYLPTRTFELVVHGLDVAAAVGRPSPLPEPVLRRCVALAAEVGAAAGQSPQLLRALTGRRSLPPGFSVVP